MILTRRKLIGGIATLIAAPAIIRVADIMRISPVPEYRNTAAELLDYWANGSPGLAFDFTSYPNGPVSLFGFQSR
jgi:hypothetical protein